MSSQSAPPLDTGPRAAGARVAPAPVESRSPTPSGTDSPRRSIAATVAALVVLALGFLPLLGWIPGGYADPEFRTQLDEWISGLAIALGIGLALAFASRHRGRDTALWREGLGGRIGDALDRRPIACALGVAAAALVAYILVALLVFDQRPLLIDEIAQVIQAQIFAEGRLWRPQPANPEFFSTLHIVEHEGRVFSQFPPGGPAFLALGVILGAAWLVGPVCGALAVLAFAWLLRAAEPRPAVRAAALVLFALAPFTVFMSGSHMNHVPTLLAVLVGAAATARAMTSPVPRPWLAFASGIGFGVAATVRPVDALAWALPAGLWYLGRSIREPRRWVDTLAAGAGVALPMALMLWVNARTTGAPLLFGYTVLWGPGHDLGFHTAPWGLEHTPARGVELLNMYFLRLQRYLFETPVPALLPVAAALLLVRRVGAVDRYLLAAGALLCGLYWAYWHDGFFVGPRFVYTLVPALALWTARLPGLARARWGGVREGLPYRTALFALLVSGAVAIAYSIPMRAGQYRRTFATERWSAARGADEAGVRNALVFVRESWEAQLVVRLWALGVSHPDGEKLYRGVDACVLEEAITALERDGVRGAAATARLMPLAGRSRRLETREVAPGSNVRVLPGLEWTPRCLRRLEATGSGAMPLAPLMVREAGDDNVYLRDLGERNALMLDRYPGRQVYLLRRASADASAQPRFFPLNPDSLRDAWSRHYR